MDMELIHDLRLYLQLIQSSAQLLMLTAGPETREYLDMLLAGVGQMERMLEHAMDDGDKTSLAPTDVVEVLRTLCLRCRGCAEGHGVRLRFETNVSGLVLITDPDRLSRVVLNLIVNALRFTPGGGGVTLSLTALGDFVEISVTDEGPGIAPERLPYIFLRGETDGGRGYGLPSASDGARLLGGSLTANASPGQGSIFTLRLPVRGAMVS